MKLKEINRTSHISWSPSKVYPCYIACGTAAQQLDASFSTTSCLEFHRLNVSDLNEEYIDATIPTESRFNKLLWNDFTNNFIIGGCENSSIYLYNFNKILTKNYEEAVVKLDKHTGTVGALDINPLQTNLLASGAGSSEILIWDLNNPTSPSVPGAKLLPLDEIQSVAWNFQVPHILASTCSGKCVVWDLRKNENIIKISDSISKLRAKLVAWHPDVATQLCLSSEDDHSPQLQMWDLRFATAPVKLFNGHTRGVLSFSWCLADSDLLVSCGKDNRILCWNPNINSNNVETVLEIPSSQWCFDVSWCSRYPHLISTASYESIINVYSLMGGKYDIKPETSNKIMDSFGVNTNSPVLKQPAPIQQQIIPQLKLAPKWMKRPCGVSFGFGGKLVTFGVEPVEQTQAGDHLQPQQFKAQKISILQVVTDQNLVEESQKLENALQSGQLIEYCNFKVENSQNKNDNEIWKFILESFNQNKSIKYVHLLGFNSENIQNKIENIIKHDGKKDKSLNTQFNSQLNLNTSETHGDSNISNGHTEEVSRSSSPINLSFDNQTDNFLCESLLSGQYESAVDLCISENRYTDAILIASFAGKDLLARTQERYFRNNKNNFSKFLESYLSQDWNTIILNCNLNHWKEALAAVLTYKNGGELYNLCNILGNRLENESKLLNACICYICSSNLNQLVDCWLKVQTNENKEKNFSAVLQDLIEKIMILQYSIKNIHRENIQNSNSLNKILIQYSKLLAEQGCFLTALNYMKDSHDSALTTLKDRLFNALGSSVAQKYGIPKPDNPFKSTQNQNSNIKSSHNLTHSRLHHNQHSTHNVNQLPQATPKPLPPPSTYQNMSQPTQPKLSEPLKQFSGVNNFIPQPINNFVPQPPNNIVPPPPSNTIPQPINTFVPQPPNNIVPQPHNNFVPQPVVSQPSNFFKPSTDTTQPALSTPAPLSYQEVRPTTGWNDPPIVAPKLKAPTLPKENVIDNSKIFQPGMHYQLPNNINNTPNMYQNQTFQQPSFNNVNQHQTTTNFYNPTVSQSTSFQPIQVENNTNNSGTNSPAPHQHATRKPSIDSNKPAAPPKQPIPDEFLNIQMVFDELLKRCMDLSMAPASKRKLEDVAKKLELLYDKLRDRSLSYTLIHGLQTMIQYIQAHDYNSTLILHTQIVGTSNFSEISAFMPSVKVLIQCCQQLNVAL